MNKNKSNELNGSLNNSSNQFSNNSQYSIQSFKRSFQAAFPPVITYNPFQCPLYFTDIINSCLKHLFGRGSETWCNQTKLHNLVDLLNLASCNKELFQVVYNYILELINFYQDKINFRLFNRECFEINDNTDGLKTFMIKGLEYQNEYNIASENKSLSKNDYITKLGIKFQNMFSQFLDANSTPNPIAIEAAIQSLMSLLTINEINALLNGILSNIYDVLASEQSYFFQKYNALCLFVKFKDQGCFGNNLSEKQDYYSLQRQEILIEILNETDKLLDHHNENMIYKAIAVIQSYSTLNIHITPETINKIVNLLRHNNEEIIIEAIVTLYLFYSNNLNIETATTKKLFVQSQQLLNSSSASIKRNALYLVGSILQLNVIEEILPSDLLKIFDTAYTSLNLEHVDISESALFIIHKSTKFFVRAPNALFIENKIDKILTFMSSNTEQCIENAANAIFSLMKVSQKISAEKIISVLDKLKSLLQEQNETGNPVLSYETTKIISNLILNNLEYLFNNKEERVIIKTIEFIDEITEDEDFDHFDNQEYIIINSAVKLLNTASGESIIKILNIINKLADRSSALSAKTIELILENIPQLLDHIDQKVVVQTLSLMPSFIDKHILKKVSIQTDKIFLQFFDTVLEFLGSNQKDLIKCALSAIVDIVNMNPKIVSIKRLEKILIKINELLIHSDKEIIEYALDRIPTICAEKNINLLLQKMPKLIEDMTTSLYEITCDENAKDILRVLSSFSPNLIKSLPITFLEKILLKIHTSMSPDSKKNKSIILNTVYVLEVLYKAELLDRINPITLNTIFENIQKENSHEVMSELMKRIFSKLKPDTLHRISPELIKNILITQTERLNTIDYSQSLHPEEINNVLVALINLIECNHQQAYSANIINDILKLLQNALSNKGFLTNWKESFLHNGLLLLSKLPSETLIQIDPNLTQRIIITALNSPYSNKLDYVLCKTNNIISILNSFAKTNSLTKIDIRVIQQSLLETVKFLSNNRDSKQVIQASPLLDNIQILMNSLTQSNRIQTIPEVLTSAINKILIYFSSN